MTGRLKTLSEVESCRCDGHSRRVIAVRIPSAIHPEKITLKAGQKVDKTRTEA